jgi:uncharacterized protein (DUF2147 family)
MKRTLIIFLLAFFAISAVQAGSNIVGKWKTIDDSTGEVKSIVEITKKNNKLYGTIIQLFNEDPNYDPLCDKCKDHLHNKKIIGMQIINGLTLDNGRWKGDDGILDPDNGKYYDVHIWVDEDDPNTLNVRGYIAFLYRTQTWVREL